MSLRQRWTAYAQTADRCNKALVLHCRRTPRWTYGGWLVVSPPLTITGEEVGVLPERLGQVADDRAAELRADGIVA